MWALLLFLGLLLGQLGRVEITPSIAIYMHDVIIACYLVFQIPLLWKQRKKVQSLTLVRPILLVGGICAISLLLNSYRFAISDLIVGLSYLVRFLMYSVLYVVVRLDKRTARYWLTWLFVLGVGYAVLGIMQLSVYPDLRNLSYMGWDPHYYRVFSTLLDPNYLGLLFIFSFLSGVYGMSNLRKKSWSIAGLSVIFIALLLTFSRSSYLAAVGGFFAYIILSKKCKLIFVLIAVCLVMLFVPAIGGESTGLFRQVTALARISNWQEGIQLFFDSPIIGYGFNMVKALPHTAPTLMEGALARSASGYDNSVVFILVTTGIGGFIMFMCLGIRLVQLGRMVMHKGNKELGSVYLSVLIALCIHSTFLNTLFYPQIMIYLWLLTGAIEKEITSRS